MAKLQSLLRPEPSPRYLGFATGVLGVFGTASYGFVLVMGGLPRLNAAYYLALSLLFIAAGFSLWSTTSRGWWLSYAAMISISVSGFLTRPPDGWPPDQYPPLFFGGFMLAAGGVFFGMLAHREVYAPCFASSGRLPHPLFGATPSLLIVAGAAVLVASGGFGRTAGPVILITMLIAWRWLFGPLWALVRGQHGWHSA